MPRGGKRQGTPGKAYSNRTDLTSNIDMSAGSPAAGGLEAPPADPMATGRQPEDSPMLLDPTQRPNEPLTAGLNSGPGADSSVLDNRVPETKSLQRWLPLLDPLMKHEDTPESVKMLVRYIRAM